MTISLIVAASENNAIGKDNKLLWHLPEDLKFFKNMTWALPVIMGRKTFEAMGKPLPGRTNIVITTNKDWNAAGAIAVPDIDAALKAAAESDAKEIFITGGGEIYRQTINIADKIYLTRVHAELEGDTFFPEINMTEWERVFSKEMKADEKHKFDMTFETWQKKNQSSPDQKA